jgi:glycine/D-amino acid oxidase-like deaminating enzyme
MAQAFLPNSLWAASAAPAIETPALAGEAQADVVVVGAGFTGLSAALHTAEAGAKVILLEAAEPGWGASGRNGGQVIPGLKLDADELITRYGAERGETLFRFGQEAADLVFELVERHAIDCHAERQGWIQAVHAHRTMALAEKKAAECAERGATVEMLSASDIAERTGAEGYAGGWIHRGGGMLQPLSFARGLAAAARAAGATIHGGSPVTALQQDSAGWRVETPGGRVDARQVVLATNAYSGGLWPGLAESVIPVFSYQIATRPLSDNLRRSILVGGLPVSDTRRLLRYFRLDHTGRLLVGGRGGQRETEELRFYDGIQKNLRTLYPNLGDVEVDYCWGGKLAITTDHVPHLHEPAPGLHAMLGYNGRGVAMATACGKLLAERLSGRQADDLALPTTRLKPIPLHGLRNLALAGAVIWKDLLDRLETRGG